MLHQFIAWMVHAIGHGGYPGIVTLMFPIERASASHLWMRFSACFRESFGHKDGDLP
jgi:hypothetical protein